MNKYLALDGIRGISILFVLFHHLNIPGFFNGGFLGVDLFFLLSGFLITRILLREFELSSNWDLKNFYQKRFLRLGPAFLCLLLFNLAIHFALHGYYMSTPTLIFRETIVPLLGLTHICAAFGIYHPQLMGHTWSLSYEMQFYFLWPFLLIACAKRSKLPSLENGLYLFLALCFILRPLELISGFPHAYISNSLEGRGASLLVGCLIAIQAKKAMHIPHILSWMAAFTLLLMCFVAELLPNFTLSLGYSLSAFCGFILISASIRAQLPSMLQKFLELRLFTWFGMISYGLYLWHFPLLGLARLHGLSKVQEILLILPLSVGISWLSWTFLESRLLNKKAAPRAAQKDTI